MDDILIVGAGPTGLTLACELLRRGRSCRLLEAAAEPSGTSKATGVSARTLEIFETLGTADEAMALGLPAYRSRWYVEGRPVGSVGVDARTDTRFPMALLLPQSDTERLLLDRLTALGGIVERGHRVTAVRQDPGRAVADVQTPAGPQRIEGRWLVGCDGVHSIVRQQTAIAFRGARRPQRFVLAEVAADNALPGDEAHYFVSRHGVVVAVALPKGRHRLSLDVSDEVGDEFGPEGLQGELDRRGAGAVRVGRIEWLSFFRISNRLADSYRRGRVLLAGDAAHVHSPLGGQGMNTGIQDAVNLGWKLDLVAAGRADHRLLDSYDAERRPVARTVVRRTDSASRLGLGRRWWSPAARAMAMRLMLNTPARYRLAAFSTQLDIAYRHSPIVDRRHGGGRRAPDGVLLTPDGRPVRLYEMLRHGGFTLLVFGAGVPVTASAGLSVCTVGRVGGNGADLVDVDGHVHRGYGVHDRALVLIRPDGHLAAIASRTTPEAVRQVLSRVPSPP